MGTIQSARLPTAEFGWVQAHAALTRLARERAAADAEEGRCLLRALRTAAHVHLGHGSFAEYVERVFGYKARATHEKLRVAEALESLPELASALDAGHVGWCAVRELTRVAVPETQGAWLDAARGETIRQLEQLVATKSPGDTPETPSTHQARSRVLRFEVAPETFALFRDALRELRRAAGGGLDDDAVLLAMARQVLAGPGDEGRASYQVSLTLCAACGRGSQLGGGEPVPIGAEVVALAACDGQHLVPLPPRAANENGVSDPALVAAANDAHVGPDLPSGSSGEAAAKVPSARAPTSADAAPSARAKQTIPPAVRRAVLARDQRRCRVPGCTHATFLDVHHVRPRSEGGRNDREDLISVCSAHHRAAHRGELIIALSRDGSPTFRHAEGSAYGHARRTPTRRRARQGFWRPAQLGLREREVRAVLTELLADDELRDATAERLLREALCRIRPMR